jgi:nucleoside triphosphate pyrophosphatase
VPRLVLASRSPQRRAILEQLSVEFQIVVPDVEEVEEGPPHDVALENAYRKAAAVAASFDGVLVLGVDTVVCIGSRMYGKPESLDDARATLTALAGRRHAVISGVCLIGGERGTRSAVAQTIVEFRALDERVLEWYLDSEEWRERAGGYAIQGRGAALVAAIDGDYFNVVGLPVPTLLELAPELIG